MRVIKSKICRCEEYKKSPDFLDIDKVMLKKTVLELCIEKHDEKIRAEKNWQIPLGMFFAFVPMYFVTNDFKRPGGSDAVEVIFYLITIVLAVATFVFLAKAYPVQEPKEAFVRDLMSKILNAPDRTALFLVKRMRGGDIELLVEKNESWGCYFLPYVEVKGGAPINEDAIIRMRASIAHKLGQRVEEIVIQHLERFSYKSEKYAEPKKVVMEFNYEVFHLRPITAGVLERLNRDEFQVADKKFEWKTLIHLKSDVLTLKNNHDVLRHLSDNYGDLVEGVTAINSGVR